MRRTAIKAATTLAALSMLAAACSAAPAPKTSAPSSAKPVAAGKKAPSTTTAPSAKQGSKTPATGPTSTQPGTFSAPGVAPAYTGPVTNPAQALAAQGIAGSLRPFPASNPAVVQFGQGPVDAAVAEMIRFSDMTTCNSTFVQLAHPTPLDASFLQPFMDSASWNYLQSAFTNPTKGNTLFYLATFNQDNSVVLRAPYCMNPGIGGIQVSLGKALPTGVRVLNVGINSTALAVTGTAAKPTTNSLTKMANYSLVANPGGGTLYPWQIDSYYNKMTTGTAVPDKYIGK